MQQDRLVIPMHMTSLTYKILIQFFDKQKDYCYPFIKFTILISVMTNRKQIQSDNQGPFIILHNFRQNPKQSPPKRQRRHHEYAPPAPMFITTRKMAEKMSLKESKIEDQQAEKPQQSQSQKVAEKEVEKQFFTSGELNELEKGIPMQDNADGDILYNINEMSRTSNYSKLQRTLFGLAFKLEAVVDEHSQDCNKDQQDMWLELDD